MTNNKLMVLAVLMGGKSYGYEISEEIKKAGGHISLGSLYGVLDSLEKVGFVESSWGDDSETREGMRRKYFTITGKGETAYFDKVRVFQNLFAYS